MSAQNELTSDDRELIMMLHDEGKNAVQISRELGLNIIAVNNIIEPKNAKQLKIVKQESAGMAEKRTYNTYDKKTKSQAIAMIKRGETQLSVAKQLGASPSTVSAWWKDYNDENAEKKKEKKDSKKAVEIVTKTKDEKDELIKFFAARERDQEPHNRNAS